MKKNISILAAILLIGMLLLTTCEKGMFGSLEELEEQAIEENSGGLTYIVTISPDTTPVSIGGFQQFTATVHGGDNPSQEVSWSVTGGEFDTVISDSGLLAVGGSETSGKTLTVTATSVAYGTSGSATAVVSEDALPPDITEQPAATVRYTRGTAATALTVAAESLDGGQLSYQWYSNASNSNSGGTNLGSGRGAQTASYTPPTDDDGTTYYYVVVTNTNNTVSGTKTASTTSQTAEVIVNTLVNAQAPTITLQPLPGPFIYYYSQSATALSVAASTSDPNSISLTYQWYWNSTSSNSGGTLISGETGQYFTPPTNFSPTTTVTRYYYAVATNTINDNGDGGTKTASTPSSPVQVTVNAQVNAASPNITTHPASNTYTVGTPVTLNVAASSTDGGDITFQWYENTTAMNSGGSPISGETTSSYSPSTATQGTKYYYVAVTNTINNNFDGGTKTNTLNSQVATITVNALVNAQPPTITTNLSTTTVPYTYKASSVSALTVNATSPDGGTISYQWYSNTVNNPNTGNTIAGATSNSYTPPVTAVGTLYYYVIITNTNNGVTGIKTATTTSNIATVTVNPKTITLDTATHTKVYDGNNTATGVTVTFTQGGTNGVESGDMVTATSITANYTSVNAGTTSISITAMTLSNANYTITTPIPRTVTGITKKNITLTAGTPAQTLIPFDTTTDTSYKRVTTFNLNVASSGLVGADTITVGYATNSYGLSVSNNSGVGNSAKAITLTYNGTSPVTQTTALALGLTLTDTNYQLSGTNNVNVTVIDGQADTRPIPVTKANIGDFNTYANTANGRQRHFKLTQPIIAGDLPNLDSNNNWTSIGTSSLPFTGSFDGGGFTITGLKIQSSLDYQGMFGSISNTTSGVVIKNLGLINCSINSTVNYTGGIAGSADRLTVIENCYTTGTISGSNFVGGIAGFLGSSSGAGTIRSCYSEATVTATGGYAGGIFGSSYCCMVENCYSTGNVTAQNGCAGGIGGCMTVEDGTVTTTIQYCYAAGNVIGFGSAAGIVVYNDSNNAKVQYCVALNKYIRNAEAYNSAGDMGRIAGCYAPNANNYGRSVSDGIVMTYNNGVGTYTPASNVIGKDGLDVARTTYRDTGSASWWTGTAGFTSGTWYIINGYLPRLSGTPGGQGVQNPNITL